MDGIREEKEVSDLMKDYGEIIDQQIYGLVEKFKMFIPPKDFDKLIRDINECQTTLHLELGKIRKSYNLDEIVALAEKGGYERAVKDCERYHIAKSAVLEALGNYEIPHSNLDGSAGYWEQQGRNHLRDELKETLRLNPNGFEDIRKLEWKKGRK